MAHASASTSKAPDPATKPAVLKVLRGERVQFLKDHFEESRRTALELAATELGAEVVDQEQAATIFVGNPRLPSYRLASDEARLPTILVPWHYLAACRIAQKRLDPAELSPLLPYYILPDNNQPVRAWVSVNIHRGNDAGPHEAKRTVQHMLELGGCIIVDKRALADLLIVDKTTKFYETAVLAEMKKFRRTWQRLVERDWVENCAKMEKMQWPARSGIERDTEHDSMEEEDDTRGKGLGRPRGKPRVEYSPEDDEFLCRYLAAYHPQGSWHSRKTYEILVKRENFAMAARHTAQSWHERFKKNAGAFTNRITRKMNDGIRQEDLLTFREAEKKRQQNVNDPVRAAQSAQGGSSARPPTNPSREPHDEGQKTTANPVQQQVAPPEAAKEANADPASQATTAAEREGARLTQIAEETMQKQIKGTAIAIEVPVKTEEAPVTTARLDAQDPQPASVPIPQNPATEPLPTTASRLDVQDSTTKSKAILRDPQPQAVSQDKNSLTTETTTTSTPKVPAVIEQTPRPLTNGTNGHAATAVAPPPAASTAQTGPSAAIVIVNEVKVAATENSAGQQASTVTNASIPAEQPGPSGLRPAPPPPAREDARSPKKVRMDVDSSPERQISPPFSAPATAAVAGPSAAPARAPSPLVVRDVREITRPRQSLPLHLGGTPDKLFNPRLPTTVYTPRKRSAMQEQMLSSEKKRRRARHSIDNQAEDQKPDVVLASTIFPPRQIPSMDTIRAQSVNRPSPPAPAPPMSVQDRHAKVLAGQAVALKHRDEYRRHIEGLCQKYGITPREMSDFANRMPKRRHATGELYWKELDAMLKDQIAR